MEQVPQTQQEFEEKYKCKMTITTVHSGDYLPCPFCGKSDLSVENLKSAWGSADSEEYVICNNCAANAPVECWQERKLP